MTTHYQTNALLRYRAVVPARWWERLGARLFGVRRVAFDDGILVTLRYWRGRYYLTDIKEI